MRLTRTLKITLLSTKMPLPEEATSAMNTLRFIYDKYKLEFDKALKYDEKKDRKFQNEMRKLQRDKLKQQKS